MKSISESIIESNIESIIASIIVNGGLRLTALETEEMNLEDVFLQVTRGETQ